MPQSFMWPSIEGLIPSTSPKMRFPVPFTHQLHKTVKKVGPPAFEWPMALLTLFLVFLSYFLIGQATPPYFYLHHQFRREYLTTVTLLSGGLISQRVNGCQPLFQRGRFRDEEKRKILNKHSISHMLATDYEQIHACSLQDRSYQACCRQPVDNNIGLLLCILSAYYA